MNELSLIFLNQIQCYKKYSCASWKILCRFTRFTKLWILWLKHIFKENVNIKLHLIYFFAKIHNFYYSREEWFITITSHKIFFLALKFDNLVLHGDCTSRNKTLVHQHYYYQRVVVKGCGKHSIFPCFTLVITAEFWKCISFSKRGVKT